MESSDINIFLGFLKEGVREDLKVKTLNEILCLTGSESGCKLLQSSNEIGTILIQYAFQENEITSKAAFLSLINISTTTNGSNFILKLLANEKSNIVVLLKNYILNSESKKADSFCKLLSNLTRNFSNATLVVDWISDSGFLIGQMINIFTEKDFNSKGCNLNYLGLVFSNLSQTHEFRKCILQQDTYLIKKLFPFVNFQDSLVRRRGIVGTLRNCCFETEYHQLLLGPDIDILPCLLLPLAGPEEFDDEDNEKLPIDLQYLDEDKKREADPDIRKMLLEALLQLCATKFGREFLRQKNAYVILREYHKWEENKSALVACENIVDILIRTEEEINENNLKEVEIPNELIDKFEKMDKLCEEEK